MRSLATPSIASTIVPRTRRGWSERLRVTTMRPSIQTNSNGRRSSPLFSRSAIARGWFVKFG